MQLSERGAFKAAICEGGYNIHPAGLLIDFIKAGLENEDFKGDFDPQKTVEKIRSVKIEGGEDTKAVISKDLERFCSILREMDAEYDIESVLSKMSKDLPKMAKHYFNIDSYDPVKAEVVDHFFQGYNDLYKDADWNAFNVDPAESKEYNVPIGIYFKRDQVSPGYPEYVIMHENVHQFTAAAGMNDFTHYYEPWIQEGFADVFGFLMLYKTTGDFEIMKKVKNSKTDFEVLDSRKSTYHYESKIAADFISSADLPLTKAFLKIMEEERANLDWSEIGNNILKGHTAEESIISGYRGNKEKLRSYLKTLENDFSKDGYFDEEDKRMLRFFASTESPATLTPSEYRAALWLMDQLKNAPEEHFVNERVLNGSAEGENKISKIKEVGTDEWQKMANGHGSFLISANDIPDNLKSSVDNLSNYFFIVKKKYSDTEYYDIFGGGLPYRMETGELKCKI